MTLIVHLKGGLGNQMYQYAMGRYLSHRLNTPFKLDLSAYTESNEADQDTPRNYCLYRYNILEQLASGSEVDWRTGRKLPKLFYKGWRGINKFLPGFLKFSIYHNQPVSFNSKFLITSKYAYIDGYWQSEKYFSGIRNVICKEFSLKQPFNQRNQAVVEEIESDNSVGIHVRRGDYVTNPVTNKFHGVCSLDYYHESIRRLTLMIQKPHFYIFSDDPVWVEQNLKIDAPTTFVDWNGADGDYLDLILMSKCKHFIIANSSFSWWAAWLCSYIEKIVFTPRHWFRDAKINYDDIIPQGWIRV
jgi:hypothetical protein